MDNCPHRAKKYIPERDAAGFRVCFSVEADFRLSSPSDRDEAVRCYMLVSTEESCIKLISYGIESRPNPPPRFQGGSYTCTPSPGYREIYPPPLLKFKPRISVLCLFSVSLYFQKLNYDLEENFEHTVIPATSTSRKLLQLL